MGGVDKGLQLYDGKPLVWHVASRLAPQVDNLLINANRSEAEYAAFGYPLLSDRIKGFAGPLAGLHAALCAASTPLVLTAPCDSPRLPLDLVQRMHGVLMSANANLAIARAGDRSHPVSFLGGRRLLEQLEAYLDGGGRKVAAWCADMAAVEVDFPGQNDAFGNFNTLDDLTQS